MTDTYHHVLIDVGPGQRKFRQLTCLSWMYRKYLLREVHTGWWGAEYKIRDVFKENPVDVTRFNRATIQGAIKTLEANEVSKPYVITIQKSYEKFVTENYPEMKVNWVK